MIRRRNLRSSRSGFLFLGLRILQCRMRYINKYMMQLAERILNLVLSVKTLRYTFKIGGNFSYIVLIPIKYIQLLLWNQFYNNFYLLKS